MAVLYKQLKGLHAYFLQKAKAHTSYPKVFLACVEKKKSQGTNHKAVFFFLNSSLVTYNTT